MTQAILEFAAPLMAYVEHGMVQDPNDALHIGMQLWNYTLPNAPVSQKPSRTAIVDTMQTTLQMDRQQADAFFERMIARKAYLFRRDPASRVRDAVHAQEVEYLITPFTESQLHLSDEIVPPDRDDAVFLDALRQLEARIAAVETTATGKRTFRDAGTLLSTVSSLAPRQGVPETLSQQFAFCLEPYLTFVYQYDAGDVQDVWPDAMAEFFMDWLMRKVMVKLPEYAVAAPPSGSSIAFI